MTKQEWIERLTQTYAVPEDIADHLFMIAFSLGIVQSITESIEADEKAAMTYIEDDAKAIISKARNG